MSAKNSDDFQDFEDAEQEDSKVEVESIKASDNDDDQSSF